MNNINVRENRVVKIAYFFVSFIFLLYLAVPNTTFPKPLPGSLQSNEPADIETPLRQSFFTDTDRQEVMNYYSEQFAGNLFKLPFLNFRLNYPPEEAQNIIRDQTRSTYLEEVVHPFRESLFINGYEPKEDKDIILVDNKFWKYKVTVKLVQTNLVSRLITGLLVVVIIPFIHMSLIDLIGMIVKLTKRHFLK